MTAERIPTVTHLVVTDLFAGVERYVTTVAGATAARGWRVRVLGGREDDMRRELPDGVEWHPAPTVPAAIRALARSGDNPGDVWHLHMTAADLAAALLPHRRTRVSTRHFAARRGSSAVARAAGRVAARRLDLQIAISETVRDATGDPAMPVLLNSVPLNDIPRSPETIVVVAQRLEPEKATSEAVAVFAASGLAAEGWRLEIHGEGSDRSAVERAVAAHGLSGSVRLAGFTHDLDAVLARAGVVLASAPLEPLGLAVVEAMATAAPVVATSTGGHAETVGAVTGVEPALTYAPGDLQAGGDVLRRLALDPGRERVGARLREWQREHLGLDTHVDRLLELYGEAARSPK